MNYLKRYLTIVESNLPDNIIDIILRDGLTGFLNLSMSQKDSRDHEIFKYI